MFKVLKDGLVKLVSDYTGCFKRGQNGLNLFVIIEFSIYDQASRSKFTMKTNLNDKVNSTSSILAKEWFKLDFL